MLASASFQRRALGGTFWLTNEFQEVATGDVWVKLLALSVMGLGWITQNPRPGSLSDFLVSVSLQHTSPPSAEERGLCFHSLGDRVSENVIEQTPRIPSSLNLVVTSLSELRQECCKLKASLKNFERLYLKIKHKNG